MELTLITIISIVIAIATTSFGLLQLRSKNLQKENIDSLLKSHDSLKEEREFWKEQFHNIYEEYDKLKTKYKTLDSRCYQRGIRITKLEKRIAEEFGDKTVLRGAKFKK